MSENPRLVYVEGKTLREIAKETKLSLATVRNRYESAKKAGRTPTLEGLATDRRRHWRLIGLDADQWLQFIYIKTGEHWAPAQLRTWVAHRRAQGRDDKEIAQLLLGKFKIKLPIKT